jgi:predicted signal transduction protein with EAL and GGDEF domain
VTTAQEGARLKDLLSLSILDTPREERFDRHTRLASKVFDMPSAIITLIDESRAWFKSTTGTDVKQVARMESICNYALSLGFLEIQDTFADAVFRDHPAARGDPPLRFYAGSVLHGPAGQPIGTFCLVDHVPRRLSQSERTLLENFAELVEQEINRDFALEDARRKIHNVTLRDSATGLLGETLLNDALESLIKNSDAAHQNLAIMHVFIENLDTMSRLHGTGIEDSFVQVLADRITGFSERILAAARVASDRFVLIAPIESGQTSLEEAGRILDILCEPVNLGSHQLRSETSVGICIWPKDGSRADELLGRARRALSDGQSGGRTHLFSAENDACVIRHHQMEERLDKALTENQLTLAYQPIFTMDGRNIVSFEALVRWRDEELGDVDPGEFVVIADRRERLSRSLTEWVLWSACGEAETWQRGCGSEAPRVAVNIPAREFRDSGFINRLSEILRTTGMSARRLTLELTEECLVRDHEQVIRIMTELSEMGIKLALDDFGTGYSSLSYLRRLPVHMLKIDKSFIDGLPDQQGAIDLVSGIIGIARGMALVVVAEGVERETQRALLAELRCDLVQGFLLGQPVAAGKVAALLDQY